MRMTPFFFFFRFGTLFGAIGVLSTMAEGDGEEGDAGIEATREVR